MPYAIHAGETTLVGDGMEICSHCGPPAWTCWTPKMPFLCRHGIHNTRENDPHCLAPDPRCTLCGRRPSDDSPGTKARGCGFVLVSFLLLCLAVVSLFKFVCSVMNMDQATLPLEDLIELREAEIEAKTRMAQNDQVDFQKGARSTE